MDFSENSSIILQKALTGDNSAWDWLFHRLWPLITGVAAEKARNIGGKPLIEDIAQNVFLRLMEDNAKRLRHFDPHKGTLERYIATITNRCAIDYIRSNMNQFRNVDLSFLPELHTEADTSLPQVEEWEMAAAIKTLSPRERKVIALLYKQHSTIPEAAATMNLTVENIRSVKSHALKKLKTYFSEE